MDIPVSDKSRIERELSKLLGIDINLCQPQSRIEGLLLYILENGTEREQAITEDLASLTSVVQEIAESISEEYDPELTYAQGVLVRHDGKLYRSKVAITVPEPWTPEHWDHVDLEDEITAIKQELASHKADTTIHVTSAEKEDWNAKYDKPSAGIPKTDLSSGVQTSLEKADSALQEHQSLAAYRTSSDQDVIDNAIKDDVSNIESLIPSQASLGNQLADKDFVNSSIGTNTAHYISDNGLPFTSVAALEAYTGTVTNNDYAFVTGTDESGNAYYDRYKATVSGSTISWAKEYRLNNSSFTAAQWASISSGITALLVSNLESHLQNTDIHVTAQDKTNWNNKYEKPTNGVPATDMTTDVQESLGKADDAVQPDDIEDMATKTWVNDTLQDYVKYATISVTCLTQDSVLVTGQTVTIRKGADASGPVYATVAYDGQPVSFSVPIGFDYFISVSDTLAHHFNPTTASGVVSAGAINVTLTYSDFSNIRTAADIKAALNAGLDLTDLVGEQITCAKGNRTLTWDVADYDETEKEVTLLLHDTLPDQMVFESSQALAYFENGLPAGVYTFKHGSNNYYFTLTEAIPEGGQLKASTSSFTTYESQDSNTALETGTVSSTEVAGATSIGTTASGDLNHMDRVSYGSNNYAESGLRQWLNSTAPANTPMPRINKFSRPYSVGFVGFLADLDASFIACLEDTVWKCATNQTYEAPASLGFGVAKSTPYTVTDKIGLASRKEIFGDSDGTPDGSTQFDLYVGATATDRKKYYNGSVRDWWLRSALPSLAFSERGVGTGGSVDSYNAFGSGGVVPACKIKKSA